MAEKMRTSIGNILHATKVNVQSATHIVAGAVEEAAIKVALTCSGRSNVNDQEVNLLGYNEFEIP